MIYCGDRNARDKNNDMTEKIWKGKGRKGLRLTKNDNAGLLIHYFG